MQQGVPVFIIDEYMKKKMLSCTYNNQVYILGHIKETHNWSNKNRIVIITKIFGFDWLKSIVTITESFIVVPKLDTLYIDDIRIQSDTATGDSTT